MGDMADDFRALREYKKVKKEDRADRNRKALLDSGLRHECKDQWQTHFHVQMPDGVTISFWPSSGAWREHKTGARTRYGWEDLMRFKAKHEVNHAEQ